MNKRFARLAKTTLIILCLCVFIGVFAYVSVYQKDDYVPARAATAGTMLDTGNGMELGVNYLRTEANTADGSQSGTGVYDGKDIYTGNGSFIVDPNELLYTPAANGLGIHSYIKFNPSSYNDNNLYNAITNTASNDFVTNANLSFNISVVDSGKTATATVYFIWSPTGNSANETVVTRTVSLDNTNTFVQRVEIPNISKTSINANAYFRMRVLFTNMTAPAYPRIRASGFVIKADTTLTDTISIASSSKYYIAGSNRRTTALDTTFKNSIAYMDVLADTYVKAGDTITLQTKVFKGEQTSSCHLLPSIYSKVFNDGGVSGTDPRYGVYWQQYSSYKHPVSGDIIDDTTIRYLTIDSANSGYKAVQEKDEEGNDITVYYYQMKFTVNDGVNNATEIIIVPQLLVQFNESGPSSLRGTSTVGQEALRLKVDSTAPESPILNTTVGLGSAIASNSWYTTSNTVSLNINTSVSDAQSREYIYAFVCSDPNLISINTTSYDFLPMLNNTLTYIDSAGQPRQSEIRQEVTLYEQSAPGRYSLSYRPVTFIDRSEQALILFRVDVAGNISIPKLYFGNNNSTVKVDSFQYTVATSFVIGKDGDTYSQELTTNPIKAANIEFFAGTAYHNPDGTFKGVATYGYASNYATTLKRDQWVTIRVSTTAAQIAAYKLIRYKNEEAEVDFYSDSMVFNKGSLGRPDYIDITFKMTDSFLQGTGVFLFYFRKNLNVSVTTNSFLFNQGRTIGIDDYIESYDASNMVTGLTYNSTYYYTFTHNVTPNYVGTVMQPSGNISINEVAHAYTGMLTTGSIITLADTSQYYVLRRIAGTENTYITTFYKVGSGVAGGMVDVGEYYYKTDINLSSTSLYFGTAANFFYITKADPEVTKLKAKNTVTYGTVDLEELKFGLDFFEFISYDSEDKEIDAAAFTINGIRYYSTKSGVLGSYQIIDPIWGTQNYNNPNVNANLRIEVRFIPIPLTDPNVFSQLTISQNSGSLDQFYDNIDGVYVIKRGAYHSGNFSSNSYVIYVSVVNAAGGVTIDGINEDNELDLVYDGSYKDITFITTPEAGLPITFSYTLVNEDNAEILDTNGNPYVYTRINNAGRYRINYQITSTACNYYSIENTSYVVINKRTLDLIPINYNEMQPELYDDIQFDFFYGIKFGKVSASTLPKPQSYIEGGTLISVSYLYSYKMIKDYSGVGLINPQYSGYFLGMAFPQTIDVGTYLLKIKVNDANNQGEITVVMVINQVIKSDIAQSTPVPYSNYAVYDKKNNLQSYLGDSTQGHIEFGQTLASQTALMLGHLTATAVYKIGSENTTIWGRFVYESESELAARYNLQYAANPSRQVSLVVNANGQSVLPVRYDSINTDTVTYYVAYVYWQAGTWDNDEFVRDNNYDLVRYDVNICVARATPVFSSMSFQSITYGQTLASSELLGKPVASATGAEGLPIHSYTLSYNPFINIVYPKGEHLINCTFTPVGNYLNNYRMLSNVQIPLTVIAKEVIIELTGNVYLVYGTAYQAPQCAVSYLTPEGIYYFPSPESMLDYTFHNAAGDVVNVFTTLGLTTYVSAAPGVYRLTLTITSNDYMGTHVIDYFLIQRGTLTLLSDPTQEIVEYGILIGDIAFYNGQCQNAYTRTPYSGSFSLVHNAGDDTFIPQANRDNYTVQRQIRFLPSDPTLYNFYNEFVYQWTYRINKNSKDVSIAPRADTLNVVYDGNDKPVDFNISYPGGSSAEIKAFTTVKYYSLDGQIEYSRVPRDAGSYKVVISVNNDFLNYAGSVNTTLTIAKQAIDINFAERYHMYTGQSQGFGNIDFEGYVGDEGAIKYTLQYFRYTGASMFAEIPVEVGKYMARITINENNFSGTADINYYIIPSLITVSGWHYVFDDKDKDISVVVEPALVDFTIRYRAEQRNDEGYLVGAFTEAKPIDAGRYQVRIIINENGYYKEIDIFNGQPLGDNLYDDTNKLTIVQSYPNEYAQKVAEDSLSDNYPLFLKISKAYAVMTVSQQNQNKSVIYNGSSTAIIASFLPNYLIATYTYTPCEFQIVDGIVEPLLVNGQYVPLENTDSVVFDSYNRPITVGFYVLTITLTDKDYQLGEYVKPTLKINPATLIIDTMPVVSGNIYYRQTEKVNFVAGSGQVRFATIIGGVWEIATDISNLKVGTYGNIAVRFIPMENGVQNINFIPPMGSITIAISKKSIGDQIYFMNDGQVLSWAGGVVISKAYSQLQITCEAWLDKAGANIEASYNNGNPLTLRVKYNGTYTAPTNVGTYTIVAEISDSNYQGESEVGTLIIERAVPAIILPVASPIPVGATLSTSGLTSGLAYIVESINEDKLRSIAGKFSFENPEIVMNIANYQKVWAVFTPTDLTTYNVSVFQIEVLVRGIDVSVAGVSATNLIYGQPLKESVLSYTSSTVPGTIRWYDENAVTDVGATARYMFIPDNTDVYNIIYNGQVSINIAKAEMDYDDSTLLIKGYVGETLGDAVNNVIINLWHSGRPYISVNGATYSLEDIDPSELIENSKQVFDCRLVVSHPNFNSIEIHTSIRTYIYLGGDNFYITKRAKQYDGEGVAIADFDLTLIGTEEQLDLSLFQMKVTKNGVTVTEIRDPGVYQVEISLFDDIMDEEITMAYDGKCTFEYTVNKKVYDGSGDAQSNQIYIKGNNAQYGGTAGNVEAFYQYKKYRFVLTNTYKIYDGTPLTLSGLGILVNNAQDMPSFVITGIRRLNTLTSSYETVASAEMAGQYIITLSLTQNVLMSLEDAPLATVDVAFAIVSGAPAQSNPPVSYMVSEYAAANDTQVKFTYFSTDKLIEYGQSAPVSAGTYSVVVTFLATNAYYEGNQEFPYTVSPMVIYVSLESAYNFEYGQNIVINPMFTSSLSSSTGLSNIGYTLQYAINNGGVWVPIYQTPVNAGNYRVSVVLTGTDYVLAAGEGVVRLDITQLKVVVEQAPLLSNIIYGQELYNSIIITDIDLENDIRAKGVLENTREEVSGTFSFKEPDKNDLAAGDRVVTLIFTPVNANYASVEIAGVPIKVIKASASIESDILSLPYNGLEQQPVIRTNPVTNLTVTFSYYQYVHGQRQNVNKPRAAGTYEVDMNISDGNYQGFQSVTFIITKAVISQEDLVMPTVGSLSYGESLSFVAFVGGRATNPANNSVIAGTFQFAYRGLTLLGDVVELGGEIDNSNPYGFKPYVSPDESISDILGVYETMPYKFMPSDTANYEIFEGTIPVTLMKATATITVFDTKSMKHGNLISFDYGVIIPEITFDTSPMKLTVLNKKFMEGIDDMETGRLFNTVPQAGTYLFTAQINDSNYTGELIYVVVINKLKAQIEFFDEEGQITDWYSYTYASTLSVRARILSTSLLPQDVQRKAEIETGLSYRYMLRNSSSNVVMHKLPENVGEYTAYAVLENGDYYIDSEALKPNYDITKANVEYLDFDASTLINMIYGSAQIPYVVTRPADIAYKVSFPGYTSMPTTAGTHRIKVVVDDPNFFPAEKTSMFYIYKKDISIDNIKLINRPYDGTDVVEITGELTGLVLNNEVRLNMTARTANGAKDPGVYEIEILSWTLSGLHANNYNVIKPVYNGTVKILQKVITDPKTSSYITSDDGFSSNVTVSFDHIYSAQNKSTLFSELFGQSAIVQTITIKELGLETVLDKKVKFHVLIPEKYRNSPTLKVAPLGELSEQSIVFVREGDYYTFTADRSGEIVFYTHDFPYWIIVVGGVILIVIIGAILLYIFAPVRRRKKIPAQARNTYAAVQDYHYYKGHAKTVARTKAGRSKYGR